MRYVGNISIKGVAMSFPTLPGNPPLAWGGVVLLHAHVGADIRQGARIHFASEYLAVM